jgi:hypothetical protein
MHIVKTREGLHSIKVEAMCRRLCKKDFDIWRCLDLLVDMVMSKAKKYHEMWLSKYTISWWRININKLRCES